VFGLTLEFRGEKISKIILFEMKRIMLIVATKEPPDKNYGGQSQGIKEKKGH
jgi:hypothetical protein